MKFPRRIDEKVTQSEDNLEALLWRLATTVNVARTEARLAFQRQLENYEILENRIRQIRDLLPKAALVPKKSIRAKTRLRGQKLLRDGDHARTP